MKGARKTRPCRKCPKRELDDVTRDPEDWMNELELLIFFRKLGFIINDVEIMTHILSNLTEE